MDQAVPYSVDGRRWEARLYYPDFLLPDFGIYLDPKNPWGMERDAGKMAAVSRLIDVRYGSLETIFRVIEEIHHGRRPN